MNKDLYGKQYSIPAEVIENLKKYSNEESISNLINNPVTTYSNLKRLKNRMENGEKESLGGDSFYGWVNQTLGSDRSSLKTRKQNRSDVGMQNQFIKAHQKNRKINNLNRPSKDHNTNNSETKITEALKRINEIIKKII